MDVSSTYTTHGLVIKTERRETLMSNTAIRGTVSERKILENFNCVQNFVGKNISGRPKYIHIWYKMKADSVFYRMSTTYIIYLIVLRFSQQQKFFPLPQVKWRKMHFWVEKV